MSYLAYPPRLPVEYSESVARLIELTLKIKTEVVPHKNEFNEALARWGRAYKREEKPLDARSCLLLKQVRKSRYWVAFAGEDAWSASTEISPEEQLQLTAELLKYLEKLHGVLLSGGICPLTKVTALKNVLVRRPVISIRQLSEDAIVSESTAKRWLRSLEARGALSSLIKAGQRQFINDELISIIDHYL